MPGVANANCRPSYVRAPIASSRARISERLLTGLRRHRRCGRAGGRRREPAIAGQFIGLVAGGVLAAIDWRAVFWVNVPVGVFGTVWAYLMLRETGERHPGRIDWWGNITFAVGLSAILIGVTNAVKPYGGHAMGWTNPTVIGSIVGGAAMLAAFILIESRVAEPMFQLALFRIRAFAAGSAAGLIAAVARGGLQFMLIIWLQGIWLPLHGYSYSETPLWAGIYLLPLTTAFLISGPVCGSLSDRFGARGFATAGMLVFAASFIGLMLLPVDFPYWAFAGLITLNGIGVGMFSAPNSASIMSSVPARPPARRRVRYALDVPEHRHGALDRGVLLADDRRPGNEPPRAAAERPAPAGRLARRRPARGEPPTGVIDVRGGAGENPVAHLLGPTGALSSLSPAHQQVLTGTQFFPRLIASAFHHGLVVVFSVATGLSVLAALASLLRGGRYVHDETAGQLPLITQPKGAPDGARTPPDRPATRGPARDGLPERDCRHARRT